MRYVMAAARLAEQDNAIEGAVVQLNRDVSAFAHLIVQQQDHFTRREVLHHGRKSDFPGGRGDSRLHLKAAPRIVLITGGVL